MLKTIHRIFTCSKIVEHHQPGTKFEKIGQKFTVATLERAFYA